MNYDFDDLARAIANGISRRDALKRMGTGLAGLLLSSMGIRRASAAVTCGTCQACDLDTSTCGLPCNPTTAGTALCTKVSQDGSYLRLANHLTTNGYATSGTADSVLFYQSGQLQYSVLVQNLQNSSTTTDTAFIGYALSPAGDVSAFSVMLSSDLPTYSLTIDPSGRVVTSRATQTTTSSTSSAVVKSGLTAPLSPARSTKNNFDAVVRNLSTGLSPTVCGEIVDETCKWVDNIFWKGLCKFISIDICTLLSGPLIPACLFALNKLCDKLNDISVADCEAQLKSSFCTCPPGQQLCNGVCCDYCQDCDSSSGACIDRTCGVDPTGKTLQCCSGTTGSTCCEGGYNCVNGVCTSPNPGCTGATCETFVPCSTNPDCVCGTVAEGGGLCVPGSTLCATLTTCVSTADCAAGSLCLIETCCGVGVCVPTSLTCPPQATTSTRSNATQKVATGPTIGHR